MKQVQRSILAFSSESMHILPSLTGHSQSEPLFMLQIPIEYRFFEDGRDARPYVDTPQSSLVVFVGPKCKKWTKYGHGIPVEMLIHANPHTSLLNPLRPLTPLHLASE